MRLHLIYTGGTIGMVQNAEGDLVPYDFTDLLSKVPELAEMEATLCTTVLDPVVDSSNMQPEVWSRLAELIWQEADQVDGFVVLHGTDTMAYTAAALSFATLGLNKPVILTGSQLPIGVLRSDARENLISALEMAQARDAQGNPKVPEVAVYFEYKLYRGNRVYKQSSHAFDAFDSPNFPPLAEAGVRVVFQKTTESSPRVRWTKPRFSGFDSSVGFLTFFPGLDESFARQLLLHCGRKAVVLETFGSGNVPQSLWIEPLLVEAIASGVQLVYTSQCRKGGVLNTPYAAAKVLNRVGVVSAGEMTAETALVKAMWLVAQGVVGDEFALAFASNVAGEC